MHARVFESRPFLIGVRPNGRAASHVSRQAHAAPEQNRLSATPCRIDAAVFSSRKPRRFARPVNSSVSAWVFRNRQADSHGRTQERGKMKSPRGIVRGLNRNCRGISRIVLRGSRASRQNTEPLSVEDSVKPAAGCFPLAGRTGNPAQRFSGSADSTITAASTPAMAGGGP